MLKSIQDIVQSIKTEQRCVTIEDALSEVKQNQGVLLDVREPSEAQEKPVEQSLNIPRGVLEMKLPELYPDANTPIYIHCATSGRASFAAEQLQRLGYRNVAVINCPIDTISKHCQKVQ